MKKSLFGVFISAVILIFLLPMISGCTAQKIVTVPEVHTEYISKTDTFISVENNYIHDSVLVRMKGDTCFVDRWHTKYRDRDVLKIVNDTIIRCDSIPIPYPVEKKISFRKQLGYGFIGFAIGFFLTLIIIAFVILIRVRKAVNFK